jgi:hypothetical protein
MNIKLLFCFFYFLFTPLGAVETDPRIIEEKYLAEFLKTHPSEDKKALTYLIVAQELMNVNLEDKAREYYEKTLTLTTKEDKTPAYIQLIMLDYKNGPLSKVQVAINELYQFWQANPHYEMKELRVVFDELLSVSRGDFDTKVVEQTYFSHLRQENHLKNLIIQKEYKKAFLLFQREKVIQASIVDQALYDLLHVLVKKQFTDELLCSVKMNKYPQARSYNIEICKILHRYLKNESILSGDLKAVEALILSEYPEKIYLVQMLRDLLE